MARPGGKSPVRPTARHPTAQDAGFSERGSHAYPHDLAHAAVPRPTIGRQRRWLRRAGALAFLSLLVYAVSTPVLTAMGDQLVHADPVQGADAIIVLAPWLDRVHEAAELYREGYAPLVLLTREARGPAEQRRIDRGVAVSREERRRRVLEVSGVPSSAIVILDGFVASTADEARVFAGWAASRSIGRVIVVTSAFHTARSRMTFQHALRGTNTQVLVRATTFGRAFPIDAWWKSRRTFREGLSEWSKLIYYRLIELPNMPDVASRK